MSSFSYTWVPRTLISNAVNNTFYIRCISVIHCQMLSHCTLSYSPRRLDESLLRIFDLRACICSLNVRQLNYEVIKLRILYNLNLTIIYLFILHKFKLFYYKCGWKLNMCPGIFLLIQRYIILCINIVILP